MQGYKELYQYCQTLQPKVSRRDILAKALEITGVASVKPVRTTLDTNLVRGFFLSAENTEHYLVRQLGTNVIVIARSLNYCWERIVFTKELMHLFDSKDERADSSEKLITLLSEFEAQQENRSSPFESDIRGLWMALACLCPEQSRIEFVDQFNKGHIDHYGIALRLKVPETYVRHYFNPRYHEIIESLIS